MRIASGQLSGKTVIDAGGLAIGEVEGLFVDDGTWRVEALAVKLRREATEQVGAHRSFLGRASIEIPTLLVQSVGDAIILRVPAADLRASADEGATAH